MRVEAFELHGDGVGREAFEFELAAAAAIERVRADGAESRHVEVIGATTDLLIRRERNANGTMRDLGMRQKVLDRGHDLRDASLVVGAEQRQAGRRHNRVADLRRQRGIVRRAQHR